MTSSSVSQDAPISVPLFKAAESAPDGYLLDRNLNTAPHYVVNSNGNYIELDDGRQMFDASGGAAVACLGHRNEEVIEALIEQAHQIAYCHSMFFKTHSTDSLAEELILSTGKRLERVYLICSGMSLNSIDTRTD